MGLFGGSSGHSKSDRSGGKRASGLAWSKQYFKTYGTDIELAERRRQSAVYDRQLSFAQRCFDSAEEEFRYTMVSQAEWLFGEPLPAPVHTLLTKVYFHFAMKGLLESGEWSRTHVIPAGEMAPARHFNLGRPMLRLLAQTYPGIASFEALSNAMDLGELPFADAAALTEKVCGLFWKKCVEAAGKSLAGNDCFEEDDVECIEAEQIVDSLLSVEGYFRLAEDCPDRDTRSKTLRGAFQQHLEAYVETLRPRFCGRDYDAEEELSLEAGTVQKLAARFALRPAEEKCVCFQDILRIRYAEEPETAIAMWRCLLNGADLSDYAEGLYLICGAMDAWEDGDRTPLLDALEEDAAFCRQLFLAAYLGPAHEKLLHACIRSGRMAAAEAMTEALRSRKASDKTAKKILQSLPRTEASDETYTYCSVRFPGIERAYSYLAGDGDYTVGDMVLAPFGRDNASRIGEIIDIRQCTAFDAPYPPEKTKKLFGKSEAPEHSPEGTQ